MQQNWHIRSRAHQCALTGRPFEEGDAFYTAIYLHAVLALEVLLPEAGDRRQSRCVTA